MMNEEFLTLTIGKQKNIALIAHDSKKPELISWCEEHKDVLKNHFLCGTGTTARMITDKTGLPVKGYNSGPCHSSGCVLCILSGSFFPGYKGCCSWGLLCGACQRDLHADGG